MLDDESIVRVLMQVKVLSPFRLNQARRLQRQTGGALYDVLIEQRLVDEAKALQAVSNHMATPCVSLGDFEGDPELLERVPRELAEAYRVLPIGLMKDGDIQRLFLAMADPTDLGAMETISQATGFDVEPVLVGPSDLRSAIARCYGIEVEEVEIDQTLDTKGSAEFADLGEWDNLELDGESDEYLREFLADSGDDSRLLSAPPPVTDRSGRETEVLDSRLPEPLPRLSANSFREFMTRSAVAILSPLDQAALQAAPAREVGSKDLLQAVVRLLIDRGIIDEMELMEVLADTRKRRTRSER